jgi:hypothetical protein
VSEERFYCEKCQIDWLAEYSVWTMYSAECPECGAYCSPFDEVSPDIPVPDNYDEPGNLTDSRDLEAVAAQEAADLAADMAAADEADADSEADGDSGEGK